VALLRCVLTQLRGYVACLVQQVVRLAAHQVLVSLGLRVGTRTSLMVRQLTNA